MAKKLTPIICDDLWEIVRLYIDDEDKELNAAKELSDFLSQYCELEDTDLFNFAYPDGKEEVEESEDAGELDFSYSEEFGGAIEEDEDDE